MLLEEHRSAPTCVSVLSGRDIAPHGVWWRPLVAVDDPVCCFGMAECRSPSRCLPELERCAAIDPEPPGCCLCMTVPMGGENGARKLLGECCLWGWCGDTQVWTSIGSVVACTGACAQCGSCPQRWSVADPQAVDGCGREPQHDKRPSCAPFGVLYRCVPFGESLPQCRFRRIRRFRGGGEAKITPLLEVAAVVLNRRRRGARSGAFSRLVIPDLDQTHACPRAVQPGMCRVNYAVNKPVVAFCSSIVQLTRFSELNQQVVAPVCLPWRCLCRRCS